MHLHEEIVGRIGQLVATARDRNPKLEVARVWRDALMLCGLGAADAISMAAEADPLRRLLHFAGTEHGLAILLVEEAISRQCRDAA